MTDCTARRYEFQGPGRRQFVASFDGGRLNSDGGAVLLREVDRQLDLIGRLTECFVDWRSPEWTEHSVEDLLRQGSFHWARASLSNHSNAINAIRKQMAGILRWPKNAPNGFRGSFFLCIRFNQIFPDSTQMGAYHRKRESRRWLRRSVISGAFDPSSPGGRSSGGCGGSRCP